MTRRQSFWCPSLFWLYSFSSCMAAFMYILRLGCPQSIQAFRVRQETQQLLRVIVTQGHQGSSVRATSSISSRLIVWSSPRNSLSGVRNNMQ